MPVIWVHIFLHFWMLQLFQKCEKGMNIHPEDETSSITQYQETIVRYGENEYCTKHRCLPVIEPNYFPTTNLVFLAIHCRSGLSFYDQYDLSSDNE
jgi:hypothetical protein